MPFRVLDQAVLDDARPGDQVEGKLEVQQENGLPKSYQLVDSESGQARTCCSAGTGSLRNGTAASSSCRSGWNPVTRYLTSR